jgi:hypothetical protein
MKRLMKLREDRKAHVAKMRAMIDAAGNTQLTTGQDAAYQGMRRYSGATSRRTTLRCWLS